MFRLEPSPINGVIASGPLVQPTRMFEMPQFSPADLARLLEFPNETLNVEHKYWLDLSNNNGKAKLAKAAIALANHGGGVIVLGMRKHEEGGPLLSQQRPESIPRYDQDLVNSAINKFAEPEVHCELHFSEHPTSGFEHAFVLVPGDTTVPVMAKVTCGGEIEARRCYIRKPGPKSEEPFNATEWRALLDRCVQARRDELLEAMRSLILEVAPVAKASISEASAPNPVVARASAPEVSAPDSVAATAASTPDSVARAWTPNPAVGMVLRSEVVSADKLTAFERKAVQRWGWLIDPLGKDDPARFPHGRYELSFEILNPSNRPTLPQLRQHMEEASRIKHTGWGPFVLLGSEPYRPKIIADAIEAWLGNPEGPRAIARDPAHCDFWRVGEQGCLFLMRGFDEDGVRSRVAPGTVFDITLPVWRVGEALLYVSRLAQSFGDDLALFARCKYYGLNRRKLVSLSGRRMLFDDRTCNDYSIAVERRFSAVEIRESIAVSLCDMLAPLYARFDFFELSNALVAEELREMTNNRF
jgi:hypothetical protein